MPVAGILLTIVLTALHVGVVYTVLLHERRQPSAMLAWLLALALLPGLGVIAWWFLGRARAHRAGDQDGSAARAIDTMLARHAIEFSAAPLDAPPVGEAGGSVLALARSLSSTPPTQGNQVELLVDGEATFTSMRDAIRGAEDHIHFQSYIIHADAVGRSLRTLLTSRAQEGLRVRVLFDGVGGSQLPTRFWKPLEEAGGEVAVFRPLGPILARAPWRNRIDFRNHRKILVVDGRVGFTGGLNAGREYVHQTRAYGRWRDTHTRMEGPVVLALQRAFATDWIHAGGAGFEGRRYFPEPLPVREGCVVQAVDSAPMQAHSPISYLHTHSFHRASWRIWLSSPYFIPIPSIEQSLRSAALRGCDVRLLVPARSDHKIVGLASESYYAALLDAGVRIFRYEPGFMHAKSMLVDDWLACVGSANMDVRSFHLNYELSAFVYGGSFLSELADQFTSDFERSREWVQEHERAVPRLRRLGRAAARLLSPVL